MTPSAEHRPTWARIDLDNLAFNFHSAKRFIGENILQMAVVKANAYGHGAIRCSQLLESEGVDWLAVAMPEEGVELRNAGITKPILILGGFWPGQESLILANDLTPVIYRFDSAEMLDRTAAVSGIQAAFHLKIDTGMGRVGIQSDEIAEFIESLRQFRNIRLEGVMTHFAAADDLIDDFTNIQIRKFNESVEIIRAKGFDPKYIDMANSPGAIAHPKSRGNMVRLGGILYGLGGDVLPAGIGQPSLKPVLSLHSRIASIKNVCRGETLGYGRTFKTERDSVIALIPIGYQDGYSRSLSNIGKVIVNGKFAPVVGRVSMDWTILDVTDIRDVKVMDEVVLIGEQNGICIRAEDIAALTNTISYEITCGISSRVPRIYRER